jgi:hypothetical protein
MLASQKVALAFGYHEDRAPTHGYAATCEAAMAAFKVMAVREPPVPVNRAETITMAPSGTSYG